MLIIADYCISLISKKDATNLMQNADLTQKKWNIIKHKNLLSHIKIDKELLTFSIIEIENNKFYRTKIPINLRDVDIDKVLASYKISFGQKAINTLSVTCIMIIKLSHYI